jgi:hypothetical protein
MPLAMKRVQETFRLLAWWCFSGFLVCAVTTAISGVLMIWHSDQADLEKGLVQVFGTAFLLTVITGLLVSGVRSMLGVLRDSQNE